MELTHEQDDALVLLDTQLRRACARLSAMALMPPNLLHELSYEINAAGITMDTLTVRQLLDFDSRLRRAVLTREAMPS